MPAISFTPAVTFDWTRPPVRTPAPPKARAKAPPQDKAVKIFAAVQERVAEILEEVDPPEPKQRPRVARLENDPDRYIRVVKGGKYQARPIDLGERYDLGLFPTRHAARAAILEFWWGKRPSLPKFTKLCHTNAGDRYIVLVPDPARPGHYLRVGTWFETRVAAGKAAERWVRRRYGARAEEVLRRRG